MRLRNVLLFTALIVLILGLCASQLVSLIHIPDDTTRLVYIVDGKNIKAELSADESTAVKDMFNGRWAVATGSKCFYSEDVSIRFGDQIFCVTTECC